MPFFFSPYLEEHGAVLVGVRGLHVIGRARVAPADGPHHDSVGRLPLQAPRQAAAARAELLRRLLEARVLQDAFWEGAPQAALAAAAAQALGCNEQVRLDVETLRSVDAGGRCRRAKCCRQLSHHRHMHESR